MSCERGRRYDAPHEIACADAAVCRVVDLHALRTTFISSLAAAGVHPRLAQALARHSTITLTMDRYTHTMPEQLTAALERLPDLSTEAMLAAGDSV